MSVAPVQLPNEVLLEIFEYLPTKPVRRGLEDLFSSILVSRQWYETGISLLWQSRHVDIELPWTMTGVNGPDFVKHLCTLDLQNPSQTESRLFLIRTLGLTLSEAFDSLEPHVWPTVLTYMSRCTNLRELRIFYFVVGTTSQMFRYLQSGLSNALADRRFNKFELFITNDDAFAWIDPPLDALSHLVTHLTVMGKFEFLWIGKMSLFRNLRSITFSYGSEDERQPLEIRRFWDSVYDLPFLTTLQFDFGPIPLSNNHALYRLPPYLTIVFLRDCTIGDVNIILGNLPRLIEFEAIPFDQHNWGDENDDDDIDDIDVPTFVCQRLQIYKIISRKSPPFKHWRAVISQCRHLKEIEFPAVMQAATYDLIATVLHDSLENIIYNGKRPNFCPLRWLIWFSNLKTIEIPMPWVSYLSDRRFLVRLCQANPNFSRIYFGTGDSYVSELPVSELFPKSSDAVQEEWQAVLRSRLVEEDGSRSYLDLWGIQFLKIM
jgi:F-box-like